MGVNGPEFVDVRPGEQILNANDTRKLMSGQYKNHLPGYADGTSDIDSFIKSVSSGASSVWDKISDTASEALEKITDPLKSLKQIVSSTFDINSVSGVGSEQRGLSGGMTDKITDGVAQALNKLKKAFDDLGGSSGGTIPSADHAKLMAAAGIPSSWFDGMNWIVNVESGWKTNATNKSSGAYGLPQSLPGSKMASAGSDWRTNPITQLKWMYDYIKDRYGSVGKAVSFHKSKGWYANGGLVSAEGLYTLAEQNKPEYVIPTDPAQHSRASMLLKEARQAVEGSSDLGLSQQVEELTNVVNQMATMMKTIIGLNADQITATKAIGTFDQNKLYKKMATDQGLSDYQSF